jgi:Tol biopolymer transport system component
MRRVFLIGAVVACAVVAWAKKPPKDPPPPADPAIAYNIRGYQAHSLMVANADGSNQTVVAQADRVGNMRWSHDNSQLCFTRTVEDLPHKYVGYRLWGIYKVNLEGSGETLVYQFPDADAYPLSGNPDWSPAPAGDGQYKIAFEHQIQEPDGTYTTDIFLVNPDCTGLTNLTNTPGTRELCPSWSRDGRRMAVIVHTGVPGANRVLYVLTLTSDGTEVSSTDCPADPTGAPWYGVVRARWAKTQDKLVVSRNGPGGEWPDLWVIDFTYPESPVITQVTDTPGFDEDAADWSEDDSQFVLMGTSGTIVSKGRGARNDWGGWVMPSAGSEPPFWLLPDANSAVVWRR